MLTTIIIILIVLAIALVGGVAFVMSRPNTLDPHRPSGRRIARMRARRRGRSDDGPAA